MKKNNTKIPSSPFIDSRKEMEAAQNEIFVNYYDSRFWVSNKNCLIQGSRGSGKTSILTVLNYKTRWFNSKIIKPSIENKDLFPEKPDIIGVNYRCEELEKNLWERWGKKYKNDTDYCSLESIFAAYINYYYLDNIIKAILDIRENFDWTKSDQDNIPFLIEEVFQTCYRVKMKQPSLYDHSLGSLRNQFRETHSSLRENILSLVSPQIIYENFNIPPISSSLLIEVCELIRDNIPNFRSMKFFFMVDDINRQEEWQVKVFNTFISSSKAPCSFKMTRTGDYRIFTNIDNRPISTTDLHISKLNDENETANKKGSQQINELFNAIFNFRVSNLLNSQNYDIELIFGSNTNIDKQLKEALKSSIKPNVKEFLREFEESGYNKITDFWLDYNQILNSITKAHVRDKKYDQYRVSAVFSLLNHFNIEKSFKYYSYDMIKMISSGSPRHFLRICDRMWDSIYLALTNNVFPIKDEVQSAAIVLASEDLFQNIEIESFDKNIRTSSRVMCDRLSVLFIKMISIKSLHITPECLSIQINDSKFNPSDLETFNKIVDWLLMIEAIKTRRENDSNFIKIALNPMLAPKFCLPYRSPFSYSYTIEEPTLFLKLLTSENEVANKIIDRIYNDRVRNDQTPTLF